MLNPPVLSRIHLINQPFMKTRQKPDQKYYILTLPESLYCEMTFDGTFYEKADEISRKIQQQLEKYKLKPAGDVFVLPVTNHWFTQNQQDYVTKLFFQVTS